VKEEFNKDMENRRKNHQAEILEIKSSLNQIKNTVESHFSRLEQVEDRISGLKDKIDNKEKNRRHLRQETQEM
jgi:chromosome segregation ATPase